MKRGICHHCRKAKATATWTMRPCAIGRVIKVRLCARCDLLLNGIAMLFARVPKTPSIIRRYAKRQGVKL